MSIFSMSSSSLVFYFTVVFSRLFFLKNLGIICSVKAVGDVFLFFFFFIGKLRGGALPY